MIYTIYDNQGKIGGILSFSDPTLAELNLSGKNYIEGSYPGDQYYIENGQAIEIPPNPSTGNIIYKFDQSLKQWVLQTEESSANIRMNRKGLLQEIDRVNPIWYASLTAEQQTELATYRQALLDVPQQANFPLDVNWPTKPNWL